MVMPINVVMVMTAVQMHVWPTLLTPMITSGPCMRMRQPEQRLACQHSEDQDRGQESCHAKGISSSLGVRQ